MNSERTPETEAFFADYCSFIGKSDYGYDVVPFGDSPEMADELGMLVLNGPKRATAGLRREFDDASLPRVDGYAVVVDGRGLPLCIFQTTEIRVGPLSSVDDAFAWDEGEGDRSRAWWLDAHEQFFKRQAQAEGFEFTPDIETVFERFKVVWPQAGLIAQEHIEARERK